MRNLFEVKDTSGGRAVVQRSENSLPSRRQCPNKTIGDSLKSSRTWCQRYLKADSASITTRVALTPYSPRLSYSFRPLRGPRTRIDELIF